MIEPGPCVSVVVTCYNQRPYIGAAIDSVLAQTALDRIREIVVVDDGSTDGSFEIIREKADGHPLVTSLSGPNSGGAATPRNLGIAQTTAPLIAFLDGDDLWLPEKLSTELETLAGLPEVGLLFSDYVQVDEGSGRERRVSAHQYRFDDADRLARLFVHGGPIIPSGAVVLRKALDDVGVFDPTMKFNEDPELWLRIAARYPIHHISRPLWRKRELDGSLGSLSNGDANLAFQHEITRRMLAREPALAAVAAARNARIAYKTALYHFATGDTRAARAQLRAALRDRPGHMRAWLALLLSYLPGGGQRATDFARSLRGRLLRIVRG